MSKKTVNRCKEIEGKTFERFFTVDRKADIDEKARTISVAWGSETPIERYFGMEVLDLSKNSVRMDRLRDGAPYLLNHNTDQMIGVIESATVDKDRVGRAIIRFGTSSLAEEIWQDHLNGIRKHISFGYRVHKSVLEESNSDSPDVYRVVDFEPFEISSVPTPADTTVGVGRSADELKPEVEAKAETKTPIEERKTMKDDKTVVTAPAVDTDKIAADARSSELARIREINAISEQFSTTDMGRDFVNSGKSVTEYREAVLDELEKRGTVKAIADNASDIGMTDKETKRFSVMKLIRAKALGGENRAFVKEAAFELDVVDVAGEHARSSGITAKGSMIPSDVMKRDMTTGAPSNGSNLIAEDLLSGSFIDILRNNMVLGDLVTTLSGLQGNVVIPRASGATAVAWVGENGVAPESQPVFDQVPLIPRTVSGWVEISRLLMIQSSIDVENYVLRDIAQGIALELDRVGLYGGGANEPSGVNTFAGLSPALGFTAAGDPTYAEIVGMESAVAVNNALLGKIAYITDPVTRGNMKLQDRGTDTGKYVWSDDNTVNGYQARVTTQVTAGDVFYGNFQDLIMGMWQGLDLLVNPYSLDTSGAVRVTGFQSADYASRHNESFVVGR